MMSNDPNKPSKTTPGQAAENEATELTEEELKAVAGAGVRYNFVRATLTPTSITSLGKTEYTLKDD